MTGPAPSPSLRTTPVLESGEVKPLIAEPVITARDRAEASCPVVSSAHVPARRVERA